MDQNFINSAVRKVVQHKEKVIKRYGNRKLYDTEQSSYVILNDIAKMIRNQENVKIIDNETKCDITSATLTQIIFAAQKNSPVTTPLSVLKTIITRGDGSFSSFLAGLGLFKSQFDNASRMKNNTQHSNGVATKTNIPSSSIQERVARAALGGSLENDNTILPTSKTPPL